jgi:hypothetical protein
MVPRVVMLWLIGLLSLITPWQSAAIGDKPQQPPLDLDAIIELLRQEGLAAVKDQFNWPRPEADFADEHSLSLDNDELIARLCRRCDDHPCVDAYIRWQLLSFSPDLEMVGGRLAARLLDALPPVQVRPMLSDEDRETIELLEDNDRVRRIDVEAARAIVIRHWSMLEMIDRANRPAIAYRAELIDRLPLDDGLRLGARLVDMRQLMEAGDTAARDELRKLKADAKKYRRDRRLTVRARRAIVTQLEPLVGHRQVRVRQVLFKADGRAVIRRTTIKFDDDDLATISHYLLGTPRPD